MKIDDAEIFEVIKNIGIAADMGKINYDFSLRDAGVDSLDMANILLAIEEKYNVKIHDEEVERLDSINSIVKLLDEKLK